MKKGLAISQYDTFRVFVVNVPKLGYKFFWGCRKNQKAATTFSSIYFFSSYSLFFF